MWRHRPTIIQWEERDQNNAVMHQKQFQIFDIRNDAQTSSLLLINHWTSKTSVRRFEKSWKNKSHTICPLNWIIAAEVQSLIRPCSSDQCMEKKKKKKKGKVQVHPTWIDLRQITADPKWRSQKKRHWTNNGSCTEKKSRQKQQESPVGFWHTSTDRPKQDPA